jgi:hypothetical protein
MHNLHECFISAIMYDTQLLLLRDYVALAITPTQLLQSRQNKTALLYKFSL